MLHLNMNQPVEKLVTQFLNQTTPTCQTSTLPQEVEKQSLSSPKESGIMTIELSISCSDNNTLNSTSDSYSLELDLESQRDLARYTKTCVKDAVEEYLEE